MHRILIAVLAVSIFALPSAVLAVGLSAGPKLGVNIANVTGSDAKDTNTKTGAALGGFLALSFSDLISLQPELLYTMKGYNNKDNKPINFNYLEIPITAKFSFLTGNVHPVVFVGPAVSILLSADFDGKTEIQYGQGGTTVKVNDLVNSTDIGALIGAGADFALGKGKLTVDLRYEMGLTSVASDKWKNAQGSTSDIKNSVISLMVGYGFGL